MEKEDHFLSTTLGGAVIAGIACILWGSAFPVIKVGFSQLSIEPGDTLFQVAFAGLRFTAAGIFLFFYMIFERKKGHVLKPIPKKFPLGVLGLGIMQTTIQYSLFYVGLSQVAGVKASIIGGLGTILLAVISHYYYKNDKLTPARTIGILVGFSSVIWINLGKDFSWSFSFGGEGLLLLTAISSASATIMAKELGKTYPPIYITALQMTFGGALLLLMGSPVLAELIGRFTLESGLLFFYAVLISAVGFALWFTLLQYQRAGDMAVYRLIIPVAGATLSATFLPGESFTLPIFLGLGAVVLGIVLSKANFQKRT